MTFTPDSLKSLLLTLQTADIELVVVGGQAINLWAMQYAQPDPSWTALQPYSSIDLDFYGGRIEAAQCSEILQGKVTLAKNFDPSPNAGVVLVNWQGQPLRIDILASVYGLADAEVANTALTFRGTAELEGLVLKVLHPLLCLEGKLKCLQNLDQSGRQDQKHCQLAVLILRAFLLEQLWNQPARTVLNFIERIADNAWTDAGLQAWYQQEIAIETAIPINAIAQLDQAPWPKFCQIRWPQIHQRLQDRRDRYKRLMER